MLKDVIHRELDRYDDWWIAPADLNIVAENIAEAISKGPEYSISASVHWPECWRCASHHACAVAEIERLKAAMETWKQRAEIRQAEIMRLLNKLDRLTDTLDERGGGDLT